MEWCRGGDSEEMEWWPVGTLNSEERAGEASEHGDVRLSAGEAARAIAIRYRKPLFGGVSTVVGIRRIVLPHIPHP